MTDWRRTSKYKNWKVVVIKRDKDCRICGATRHLHAHHLNHATYFEEYRYATWNGITLCDKCHMNFHCNYHSSYREKCTTDSFINCLSFIEYIKGSQITRHCTVLLVVTRPLSDQRTRFLVCYWMAFSSLFVGLIGLVKSNSTLKISTDSTGESQLSEQVEWERYKAVLKLGVTQPVITMAQSNLDVIGKQMN